MCINVFIIGLEIYSKEFSWFCRMILKDMVSFILKVNNLFRVRIISKDQGSESF